jgi:hypothetical protein
MLTMVLLGNMELFTQDLLNFLYSIPFFLKFQVLQLIGLLSHLSSVKIDFTSEEEPMRGPGIVKVSTKILDDPAVVLQIGKEIEEMMNQTDYSWRNI